MARGVRDGVGHGFDAPYPTIRATRFGSRQRPVGGVGSTRRGEDPPETGRGGRGMTGRAPKETANGRAGSGRPPVDRARLVGCLFGGAMAAAPLLALLYGPSAGLVVAAVSLAATAGLTADAAKAVPAATRRRVLVVAAVNAALALACLAVLVARWA